LSIWDRRRLVPLGLLWAALLRVYCDPMALTIVKRKADRAFSGGCERTATHVQLSRREDGSCEYEPGSCLDRIWTTGDWSRSSDTVAVWTSSKMNRPRLFVIYANSLTEVDSDTLGHQHGFAGSTMLLSSAATP